MHRLTCCFVTLALCGGAVPAAAQRAVGDATDVRRLLQKIDSLERRLAFLETRGIGPASADGAAEAQRISKLEERVAALQRAVERGNANAKPNAGDTKVGSQIVQAPFVVVDKSGSTLFRVDIAPDGLGRAVVGDAKGASVHIGPDPEGTAAIRMYSANGARAAVMATKRNAFLQVVSGAKTVALGVDATDGGLLKMNNEHGQTAVLLRYTTTGVGHLALADATGIVRVEAGTNPDKVGWVETNGPGGGRPASQLGLPASRIIGKK